MTHALTDDQATAYSAVREFILANEPDPLTGRTPVSMLIEGGAGTGKTYLLGQILKHFLGRGVLTVCCTPTHKATNVLRKKLDAFGVNWVRGYDPYTFDGCSVVTGTTAQLLGIGPVITEDQDKKVKFGKRTVGILGKVTPRLLVIDEVSMLGARDFLGLLQSGRKTGMKILAVGDAAQLPPVKQAAIPFEQLKRQHTLRQVVRQEADSVIIRVAWLIREGQPWREEAGKGLRKVGSGGLSSAFLEVVQRPGERAEEDREVFIAYRNRVVDEVQEQVCQRLYRHGRLAFAPGELVLSETNFYRGKTLLCANQDDLVVLQFHEDQRDPTTGVPVTLRHRGRGGSFQASYLSPEELADAGHSFNVELKRLEHEAQSLQQQYNALPRGSTQRITIDPKRRQAWSKFFEWRDQTVISFRHPFAITSHRSQGSTYKAVYADVADLARHSTHALYVAVTRPREELVVTV